MGLAREHALYEGQGAVELEAAVDPDWLANGDEALDYPFAIPRMKGGFPYIEPLAMWQAVLGDLILATPLGVMAARFHRGLAKAVLRMIEQLVAQSVSEPTPIRPWCLRRRVPEPDRWSVCLPVSRPAGSRS